jgi:hypothetical protein
MRLQVLEHGHTDEQKQFFGQMRAKGVRLSDMMKLCYYHTDFFGTPFLNYVHATLHEQPSFWTQGEKELFAAFIARLNACAY